MKAKITGWGNKRIIIYLLVIIILALVLIPQRNQLVEGLKSLAHADWRWLAAAVGFLVLTYVTTSVVYKILAKKPIRFFTTFLVQIAGSFANRIVPAGLGGLGLNADYLIKNKHTPIESGTVVGINSLMAILNHATLIAIAVLVGGVSISDLLDSKKMPVWALWVFLLGVLALVVIVFSNFKIRSKIKRSYKGVIANLKAYKSAPHKIVLAYIGAGVITSLFVLTLYSCARAVGLDVSIAQTFVVYTVGVIIGAAVLTPGGLGGVEAGMYAAFVAYGGKSSTVFAAVIIYRLLTYWLPILPGAIIFLYLRKRKKI